MVLDKGSTCAKATVIIFTLLFWCTGFGLLFLGGWMLLDPQRSYLLDLVPFFEDDPLLKFAAFTCIGAGAVTLIVGFLGCCGALMGVRCMLGAFVIFLLLLFLAELSIGVLALLFKEKFSGDLMPKYLYNLTHNRYYYERWATPLVDTIQYYADLKRLVQSQYGLSDDPLLDVEGGQPVPLVTPQTVTVLIDKLQFYRKCCGSSSGRDYEMSYWYKTNTERGTISFVPASCCTQTQLARAPNVPDSPVHIQAIDPMCISYHYDSESYKNAVHQEGCHAKLQSWFDMHSLIFIAVGFGCATFQLIGIIAALCLCRQIHDYTYL